MSSNDVIVSSVQVEGVNGEALQELTWLKSLNGALHALRWVLQSPSFSFLSNQVIIDAMKPFLYLKLVWTK